MFLSISWLRFLPDKVCNYSLSAILKPNWEAFPNSCQRSFEFLGAFPKAVGLPREELVWFLAFLSVLSAV